MTLTFGSLFSGVGGMDLGLERAGLRCVFQVEIDPFCRRVLAKHWPDVRRHDDVRTFPPGNPDDWRCDLIAGGFPCQDISNAGRRAGIGGVRSGLWFEFARVVRLVRPRCALVENVAALLERGVGRVLGDLAACGYDTKWDCLPAVAFGAPHTRDRVFLVAAHAVRRLLPSEREGECHEVGRRKLLVAHGQVRPVARWQDGHWGIRPDICRVADGVPRRVDRLRAIGNVAEFIGRRIVEVLACPPS
jgi:DNA (cytosine-5)-methyltransferase 1